MALNERWTELFDQDGSGARMTLDHVPPSDGGGGGPDLRADVGPWTTAAGVANGLHESSASALTELDAASVGVPAGTQGFAGTAALEEIRTSWKERLASVREECSRLEGALKSAGTEFGEQETATQQQFRAQGGPR